MYTRESKTDTTKDSLRLIQFSRETLLKITNRTAVTEGPRMIFRASSLHFATVSIVTWADWSKIGTRTIFIFVSLFPSLFKWLLKGIDEAKRFRWKFSHRLRSIPCYRLKYILIICRIHDITKFTIFPRSVVTIRQTILYFTIWKLTVSFIFSA